MGKFLSTMVLALVVVFAMASPAWAADIPPEATPATPRTCLVLGGGGARGAAHIGLLKVLEREHVQVDCIVGTSMGAIVGGLYAAGYKADEIEAVLTRIDWKDIFHDKPSRDARSMRRKQEDLRWLGGVEVGVHDGKIAFPRGLVQGQKLQLLLRRLLLSTWQVENFDDLPIPFRAIATDIVTGEKVVFSEGDLAVAIRASMSVPAAFEPIRVDGRLLVDGGVVDNVPVDEARKLGAQRMIVSRVGSPLLTEDSLDSPLAITHQMMSALTMREVEAQLASLGPQDLLIRPELGTMGSEQFDRAGYAVGVGQAAAEANLQAIRRYAVDDAAYAAFQARHQPPAYDAPMIAFVDVLKDRSHTGEFIEDRMAGSVGKPLDLDQVESEIGVVYGDGLYQQVQWGLEKKDGLTGLSIDPVDKDWGPDYLRFGLRLSDDFAGRNQYQLRSELSFTGLNAHGGEARIGLGLGEVTQLRADYYQPFGHRSLFSFNPYFAYLATDLPLDGLDRIQYAEFRRSQLVGGVQLAFSPDNAWQLFAGMERGEDRARLLIGDSTRLKNSRSQIGSLQAGIAYDTLDSSAFPTRGQRVVISQTEYLPSLGSEVRADVTRFLWDGAWSAGKNHLLLGARVHASTGGQEILAAYGVLGGLANFSGYGEDEIRQPQAALARAVFYRRIGNLDSALSIPLYLGGSLEAGGFWRERDDMRWGDLQGAGSLFFGVDSFLGPIFVGYGRAENGRDSFYLTFGSLLRTDSGF